MKVAGSSQIWKAVWATWANFDQALFVVKLVNDRFELTCRHLNVICMTIKSPSQA
jgi:hypothetical protein